MVCVVWPGGGVEACFFGGGGGARGVATDENKLAADAVQVGDAVLSVPEGGVGGDIVFFQELGEVLVGCAADAFSFQTDEDGFAWVRREEVVTCLQDGLKVLWA